MKYILDYQKSLKFLIEVTGENRRWQIGFLKSRPISVRRSCVSVPPVKMCGGRVPISAEFTPLVAIQVTGNDFVYTNLTIRVPSLFSIAIFLISVNGASPVGNSFRIPPCAQSNSRINGVYRLSRLLSACLNRWEQLIAIFFLWLGLALKFFVRYFHWTAVEI